METAEQTKLTLPVVDKALNVLQANKTAWAEKPVKERIELLQQIKKRTLDVAAAWVDKACAMKNIPHGSPLAGEEWLSGPYTLIAACNGLINTLSQLEGKKFVDSLNKKKLANGQLAVELMPHSIWDHLLFSGIKAELWMQPGVNVDNLKANTASAYDIAENERQAGVALVLGAGNIAAITPLDCFHKLFLEHQVVLLKMNPVNDYLGAFFEQALSPLIDQGYLQVVKGGGDVGAYLCEHETIVSIHITGSKETHDLIVWGSKEVALANKQANTPVNTKPITSELGAVCPTIIVPSNWTKADLRFQAHHVATQKLHNSGCNCVASQVLILSKQWPQLEAFLLQLQQALASAPERDAYYPGFNERLDKLAAKYGVENFSNFDIKRLLVNLDEAENPQHFYQNEIFAQALGIKLIDEIDSKEFLTKAIEFSNSELFGTLGANIIIEPKVYKKLGQEWQLLLTDLKYGTIAINAWTGLGFLTPICGWGGYPGHTLEDAGSGIGMVHNTFMFDKLQRTIVEAPFRPFPRNLLHGGMTLLPNPPWYVHNTRGAILGKLLTAFQFKPSFLKLPRIFFHALTARLK
ncbi:aldehyde dehydrogenase family protein [Paraferrimonas sp. SM1919]|uniref:aldehyde dehydrogenase family protein n=1 Tax=Paraferrimonas sp. SM1919 TaxID=2662263 RepID=UPI0013CFB548|nr:aldehyde dehydrogenase family protein [Paraferrimonas sp. SM1919]